MQFTVQEWALLSQRFFFPSAMVSLPHLLGLKQGHFNFVQVQEQVQVLFKILRRDNR